MSRNELLILNILKSVHNGAQNVADPFWTNDNKSIMVYVSRQKYIQMSMPKFFIKIAIV